MNLDADVTFEPDYFERLLEHFDENPALGIASGSAFELEDGEWRQRFTTRATVWGARAPTAASASTTSRRWSSGSAGTASTSSCAIVRGWETATFLDLPFHHHRRVGARDPHARATWIAGGTSSPTTCATGPAT